MSDFGEIIWASLLDNTYECFVSRLSENQGQLRVVNTDTKEVLLDQEVALSYGAPFGPDVDDLAYWQDLCAQIVDQSKSQG